MLRIRHTTAASSLLLRDCCLRPPQLSAASAPCIHAATSSIASSSSSSQRVRCYHSQRIVAAQADAAATDSVGAPDNLSSSALTASSTSSITSTPRVTSAQSTPSLSFAVLQSTPTLDMLPTFLDLLQVSSTRLYRNPTSGSVTWTLKSQTLDLRAWIHLYGWVIDTKREMYQRNLRRKSGTEEVEALDLPNEFFSYDIVIAIELIHKEMLRRMMIASTLLHLIESNREPKSLLYQILRNSVASIPLIESLQQMSEDDETMNSLKSMTSSTELAQIRSLLHEIRREFLEPADLIPEQLHSRRFLPPPRLRKFHSNRESTTIPLKQVLRSAKHDWQHLEELLAPIHTSERGRIAMMAFWEKQHVNSFDTWMEMIEIMQTERKNVFPSQIDLDRILLPLTATPIEGENFISLIEKYKFRILPFATPPTADSPAPSPPPQPSRRPNFDHYTTLALIYLSYYTIPRAVMMIQFMLDRMKNEFPKSTLRKEDYELILGMMCEKMRAYSASATKRNALQVKEELSEAWVFVILLSRMMMTDWKAQLDPTLPDRLFHLLLGDLSPSASNPAIHDWTNLSVNSAPEELFLLLHEFAASGKIDTQVLIALTYRSITKVLEVKHQLAAADAKRKAQPATSMTSSRRFAINRVNPNSHVTSSSSSPAAPSPPVISQHLIPHTITLLNAVWNHIMKHQLFESTVTSPFIYLMVTVQSVSSSLASQFPSSTSPPTATVTPSSAFILSPQLVFSRFMTLLDLSRSSLDNSQVGEIVRASDITLDCYAWVYLYEWILTELQRFHATKNPQLHGSIKEFLTNNYTLLHSAQIELFRRSMIARNLSDYISAYGLRSESPQARAMMTPEKQVICQRLNTLHSDVVHAVELFTKIEGMYHQSPQQPSFKPAEVLKAVVPSQPSNHAPSTQFDVKFKEALDIYLQGYYQQLKRSTNWQLSKKDKKKTTKKVDGIDPRYEKIHALLFASTLTQYTNSLASVVQPFMEDTNHVLSLDMLGELIACARQYKTCQEVMRYLETRFDSAAHQSALDLYNACIHLIRDRRQLDIFLSIMERRRVVLNNESYTNVMLCMLRIMRESGAVSEKGIEDVRTILEHTKNVGITLNGNEYETLLQYVLEMTTSHQEGHLTPAIPIELTSLQPILSLFVLGAHESKSWSSIPEELRQRVLAHLEKNETIKQLPNLVPTNDGSTQVKSSIDAVSPITIPIPTPTPLPTPPPASTPTPPVEPFVCCMEPYRVTSSTSFAQHVLYLGLQGLRSRTCPNFVSCQMAHNAAMETRGRIQQANQTALEKGRHNNI